MTLFQKQFCSHPVGESPIHYLLQLMGSSIGEALSVKEKKSVLPEVRVAQTERLMYFLTYRVHHCYPLYKIIVHKDYV